MTPAANEPGAFAGFPYETFRFLFELAGNNEKPWFDAHRTEYEEFYLKPAIAFVATIGPRLQAEVSPQIHYEAKINGSLFRINRDVRFAKDKSPYKEHLDFWFWQGDRRGWSTPSYYLRLTGESASIGAGLIHMDREMLTAWRTAVVDPIRGRTLAEMTAKVDGVLGLQVGREDRAKVPRGFDPAHPNARFLKMEGLFAMATGEPPAEVSTPAFVDYCIERYRAAKPISDWLLENLPAPVAM